ncbi:MAG: hypothetical protein ACPGVN_03880 [Alphaproteobacteria bacterium]
METTSALSLASLLPLIISAVSGAAGGNVAAKFMSNLSMGTIGNTIAGLLGGVALAKGANIGGTGDIGSILAMVGTGAVGGGALTGIVGVIRNLISR